MAAVSNPSDYPDATPDNVPEDRTGHPLFPRSEHETGPERRRIDLIHIERARDDGTWETCPKTFKASELRSWKDVVDLYGGGAYRARAQCGKTYQWQGTTERKEFAGPSKPFVEEAKRPPAAPAPSAPASPAPLPPHGPATVQNAPGYPPPTWTAPNPHEPPPWVALLIKAMDRPAAPPQDHTLIGLMFKAMTDQQALVLKLLVERQAAPNTAAPNTLEVIRELKPLLDSNTAPGQFMQGIEIAKSLMQQSAPPAAPEEDLTSTLMRIMGNLGGGAVPIPGVGAPVAPAPAAPAAPPAPAAPQPSAPTMSMDDMLTMIANDRHLTRLFVEKLRQRTATAPPPAAPSYPTAAPPPAPAAVPSSAPPASPAPSSSAPLAPASPAAPPPAAPPPAPAAPAAPAAAAPAPADEAQVGTTVATEAPPLRSFPPLVTEDGTPIDFQSITEGDLRALVASLFDGEEASAAPVAPPPPGAPPPQAMPGPLGDLLLAITGRTKGEA